MTIAIPASDLPNVQVFSASVLRNTGYATTALVAPNIPASVDWLVQANQIGAIVDQLARYGAGIIGIPDGPTAIVLTAPGTGLLLGVSAGQAMIGGPVQIAAQTCSVPDDTARVWIWLQRNGAVVPLTTTAPPSMESCLLGSCVTSGGNITSVDLSGVVYLRGGKGQRATADDGAPSDTPPAGITLETVTPFCAYDWNGVGHRQKFIPNVTADPAAPGAEDMWFRTDLGVLKISGGDAIVPTLASAVQSLSLVLNNGTSALAAGQYVDAVVEYACTIDQHTLLADQSGSVVIDLRKCSYADFDAGATHPVSGDSICASALPTLAGAVKAKDSTLTGWTLALAAGDILRAVVVSAAGITQATLSLKVTRV